MGGDFVNIASQPYVLKKRFSESTDTTEKVFSPEDSVYKLLHFSNGSVRGDESIYSKRAHPERAQSLCLSDQGVSSSETCVGEEQISSLDLPLTAEDKVLLRALRYLKALFSTDVMEEARSVLSISKSELVELCECLSEDFKGAEQASTSVVPDARVRLFFANLSEDTLKALVYMVNACCEDFGGELGRLDRNRDELTKVFADTFDTLEELSSFLEGLLSYFLTDSSDLLRWLHREVDANAAEQENGPSGPYSPSWRAAKSSFEAEDTENETGGAEDSSPEGEKNDVLSKDVTYSSSPTGTHSRTSSENSTAVSDLSVLYKTKNDCRSRGAASSRHFCVREALSNHAGSYFFKQSHSWRLSGVWVPRFFYIRNLPFRLRGKALRATIAYARCTGERAIKITGLSGEERVLAKRYFEICATEVKRLKNKRLLVEIIKEGVKVPHLCYVVDDSNQYYLKQLSKPPLFSKPLFCLDSVSSINKTRAGVGPRFRINACGPTSWLSLPVKCMRCGVNDDEISTRYSGGGSCAPLASNPFQDPDGLIPVAQSGLRLRFLGGRILTLIVPRDVSVPRRQAQLESDQQFEMWMKGLSAFVRHNKNLEEMH